MPHNILVVDDEKLKVFEDFVKFSDVSDEIINKYSELLNPVNI